MFTQIKSPRIVVNYGIPIEIQMKYKARARGNILGNLYHFDSVEFSDIEIELVKINY